jgi:hypothetical protein
MSLVSQAITIRKDTTPKKKGGLEKFADTISAPFEAASNLLVKPVVETFAKPFGETIASSYELAGRQAPAWTRSNRLSSPEILALDRVGLKGLTSKKGIAQVRNTAQAMKNQGYKGAGATDILNVLSLLPGGAFAKGGQAIARGAEVASGAERFLPTLGRTFKETVPAAAGWGTAYGAAEAYDQDGSARDIATGALKGGLVGTALGLGLGTASAIGGAGLRALSKATNKSVAEESAVRNNLRNLNQLEDNNTPLKKLTSKYMSQGIDVKDMVSKSDYLKGAVDSNGVIHTLQEGGALSQVDDYIKPYESVVSDLLKREGNTIGLDTVEASMRSKIDSSGLEGEALDAAHRKVSAEISGLIRRADKSGRIPVALLQDAKVNKYSTINYLDPASKKADKTIARTYRDLIAKNTTSADVNAVNKELQKYYAVKAFLEKLDGRKVQGGRLGKYFAQTVGSIAGSHFGPIGSILGAELGGRIRGMGLTSTFNKGLGRGLTESDILMEAKALSKTPRPLVPEHLRLPAPDISKSGPVIPLRGPTTYESRAPIVGGEGQNLKTAEKILTQPSGVIEGKLKTLQDFSDEINSRVDKFRKEAGIIANREGAGVRLRSVEDGAGNINFVTKGFNLNRAKANMKAQADSAKKYAKTLLYDSDEEFRSLVDFYDALLEEEAKKADTIQSIDKVLQKINEEIDLF